MKIEELSAEQQSHLKTVCQRLFYENYLLEFRFSATDGMKKVDPDYTFALQKRAELEELLYACGWDLKVDDRLGVIYLSSDHPSAYIPLKKVESQFLLALRLLYDERRLQVTNTSELWCTVRDIIEKLNTLGAIDNITKQDRAAALRTLEGKHLIEKLTGQWSELETKLIILPSVACALSIEKIAALRNSYADMPVEKEDAE